MKDKLRKVAKTLKGDNSKIILDCAKYIEEKEKELNEAKKRLAFSLEGSNSGFWDWNLETNVVYFDENYYTMAGYKNKEFPEHFDEWAKRVHPDDFEYAKKKVEAYLGGKIDKFSIEFRFKKKSGKWMWILGQGKVFEYGKEGNPIRFAGTHVNINHLKKTEQDLKTTKNYYENIFENNPVSLWLEDFSLLNTEFEKLKKMGVKNLEIYINDNPGFLEKAVTLIKIIDVNKATLKLHNAKTKSQLYGGLKDTFTENSYKAFKEELIMLWNGEREISVEGEVNTLDGKLKYVHVKLHVLSKRKAGICNILVSIHDMTERKMFENSIISERNKAQLYMDISGHIFLAHDLEGIVTLINKKGCEIIGVEESEIIGKNWIKSFIPNDKQESTFKILEKFNNGEYEEFMHNENQIINSKGEIRIIAWHNAIVKNELGEPIGVLSSGDDITEKKQSEKALIESQRLGAIGEMATAIAHDFNNSLQAIFGNLELALLNKNLPKNVINYLNMVKSSAEDAATKILMLQRFGGTKKGTTTYNSININKLIDDVIEQTKPVWKDKSQREGLIIHIEKNFNNVPFVLGNCGELRSVIYTVLKNCFEAMPEGGIINIYTDELDEKVSVKIADTGVGMDENIVSRVFQPFFSTKGFELGRGFGLSGAYSIISEHGGSIKIVETGLNKGTTVEILLPIQEIEKAKKNDSEKKKYKGKILWVDDEEHIRDIASDYLEILDFEGDIASGGFEALSLLEKNKYDLVITDIGMPGMNGWQLAKEIKEKFNNRMKVIVLTGWGAEISEKKKIEYSVEHVIGKPISLKTLENYILKTIKKK